MLIKKEDWTSLYTKSIPIRTPCTWSMKHNYLWETLFKTLSVRTNVCHFSVNISNAIFFNENAWISIKISLRFVPKDQINNIPAFVWIIIRCQLGDKPLSEQVMVSLTMHTCTTQPQQGWYVLCQGFIICNLKSVVTIKLPFTLRNEMKSQNTFEELHQHFFLWLNRHHFQQVWLIAHWHWCMLTFIWIA